MTFEANITPKSCGSSNSCEQQFQGIRSINPFDQGRLLGIIELPNFEFLNSARLSRARDLSLVLFVHTLVVQVPMIL